MSKRLPQLPHAQWRKSSRSSDQGACVELAELPASIAIRDSKNPDGPTLSFNPGEFRVFAGRINVGELDLS